MSSSRSIPTTDLGLVDPTQSAIRRQSGDTTESEQVNSEPVIETYESESGNLQKLIEAYESESVNFSTNNQHV